MPERHAILIAGMHRSGTSALTRVLSLLGASLGTNLAPASTANPKGFWEEREIVRINEDCLTSFGLSWRDPGPLPVDWLQESAMAAWRGRLAEEIEKQHGDHALFAIKDPRISRLLPAWLQVLHDLGIVPHVIIPVRDPLEVAVSLMRRDNMSPVLAQQLWLAYTLEAECASRSTNRAIVLFDDLITDWRDQATRLQRRLAIQWPTTITTAGAQVDEFLDSGLRHHVSGVSTHLTASSVALLANTVLAYARATSAGTEVPTSCWDAAAQQLAMKLHVSNAEAVIAPAWPTNTGPSLGHWEPLALTSDVIQARLYYRRTDEASEEDKHVAAVIPTVNRPLRARFELPRGAIVDFLRLDPAMQPGTFRIHEMRVNGRNVLHDDVRINVVHERMAVAEDTNEFAVIFSSDDDPYIEIDIQGLNLATDNPRIIEFLFDHDSLFDRLDRPGKRRDQVISGKITALEKSIIRLDESIKPLGTGQRQAIDAALGSIQAAIGRLAEAGAASDARLRTTEDQLAQLHADLASLHGQHDLALQCDLDASGWSNQATATAPEPDPAVLAQDGSRLVAEPEAGLRSLGRAPGTDAFYWQSTSEQAFFTSALPGHAVLPTGWYEFDLMLHHLDDAAEFPSLKLSQSDRVFLESRGTDETGHALWHCIVQVVSPTDHLHLFPGSSRQGRFQMSLPRIRKAGTSRTLAGLSRRWLDANSDIPRSELLTRATRNGFKAIRKGGLKEVLRQLHAMYAKYNQPR